ncbi:MAG TPA: CDP-alcohol phosphatidyltransferase family protein [Balneolales bacterium]|nr:CDP-alcohol phosphatidyltransferase family protein [Balneolales bacterium]
MSFYSIGGNINKKGIKVRHRIFTISNLISFSRVFVAIPVIYLHFRAGYPTLAVDLLIAYAIGSDFLDGYLARKTDQISELGKVLDPMADKMCAFIVFSYTVFYGLIPLWFFILLIVRDLLIASGAIYIKSKRSKIPMSVMAGKITINVLAVYWLAVFYFPAEVQVHTVLLWLSTAMMIYSFFVYLQRFVSIIRGAEFN